MGWQTFIKIIHTFFWWLFIPDWSYDDLPLLILRVSTQNWRPKKVAFPVLPTIEIETIETLDVKNEKNEIQSISSQTYHESHPSTHIKQELEQNLIKLLDQDTFVNFLKSDQAREEFREWLVLNDDLDGNGIRKLDRWTDEEKIEKLNQMLRNQCEAVFSKFLSPSCPFVLCSREPTGQWSVSLGNCVDFFLVFKLGESKYHIPF